MARITPSNNDTFPNGEKDIEDDATCLTDGEKDQQVVKGCEPSTDCRFCGLSFLIASVLVFMGAAFIVRISSNNGEVNPGSWLCGYKGKAPVVSDCDPEDWSCFDLALVAFNAVTGIQSLHDDLGTRPVLQDEEDFDVSSYFNILTHIHLEEGEALDYVYHNDGVTGYPKLYVRNEEQEPFHTEEEFERAKQHDGEYRLWLDAILTDDSPAGYLELVTLSIMGKHFYLWQVGYRDTELVWYLEMAQDLIHKYDKADEYEEQNCRRNGCFSSDALELAQSIDWLPHVERSDDGSTVAVSIMVFTKYGGFSRRVYSVAREGTDFNERFLDMADDNLIKYPVGMAF